MITGHWRHPVTIMRAIGQLITHGPTVSVALQCPQLRFIFGWVWGPAFEEPPAHGAVGRGMWITRGEGETGEKRFNGTKQPGRGFASDNRDAEDNRFDLEEEHEEHEEEEEEEEKRRRQRAGYDRAGSSVD